MRTMKFFAAALLLSIGFSGCLKLDDNLGELNFNPWDKAYTGEDYILLAEKDFAPSGGQSDSHLMDASMTFRLRTDILGAQMPSHPVKFVLYGTCKCGIPGSATFGRFNSFQSITDLNQPIEVTAGLMQPGSPVNMAIHLEVGQAKLRTHKISFIAP